MCTRRKIKKKKQNTDYMEEEKYMWRCLQLARNGLCGAAPNPMVGAVVVCDGRIIGEGYHVRCGEAHAEVNALRSVADPSLLKRSTVYVSLEPCAHFGKTPPCADLLVEKQVPRVVVGCQDPFARVAGRGIEKLRQAGCQVTVGVLERECRFLNRRFITFHTLRRPYVTLKWAQSADGYIGVRRAGLPVRLSSPLTAILVHKRRSEHAAIMVGTDTALLDNPSLTVRHWYGQNPVRVVPDRELRLPVSLHLFDGTVPTLVFTQSNRHPDSPNTCYVEADFGDGRLLPQVMQMLHERNLQSLLVEGGSRLLQTFLEAGLWDEIYVETSPVRLGGGVKAPQVDAGMPHADYTVFGRNIRRYLSPRLAAEAPEEILSVGKNRHIIYNFV